MSRASNFLETMPLASRRHHAIRPSVGPLDHHNDTEVDNILRVHHDKMSKLHPDSQEAKDQRSKTAYLLRNMPSQHDRREQEERDKASRGEY